MSSEMTNPDNVGGLIYTDYNAMNGLLCDFATRWEIDGDYIRCRNCKRPQLTSYGDNDFPHSHFCRVKGSPNMERRPWQTYVALLAPLCRAAPAGGDELTVYYVAEVLGGDFDNIPISMFGGPALFTSSEAAGKFCDFANAGGRIHEVRQWNAISSPPKVASPAGGDMPPEDHRHEAGIDAELLGTGFLVDGKRVAPERVEMIRRAAPAGSGEVVDALAARFVSGNGIPVERTHITRTEYDALLRKLSQGAAP